MFLSGQGTLASCLHQEETRDKKVPVAAAGSGPLADKLAPEYPEWSGMSVAVKKSPCQSHHLLLEEGPHPGPETGLLSNTRKQIVRGDTCAEKARDFIGKGHPGGEQ